LFYYVRTVGTQTICASARAHVLQIRVVTPPGIILGTYGKSPSINIDSTSKLPPKIAELIDFRPALSKQVSARTGKSSEVDPFFVQLCAA
jgi:hypothetical protein